MDEEAELALLDQQLLKTNTLGQRMTSILSQLDTRLSKLDKSIAPLGLQPLTLKSSNIDAAILAVAPKLAAAEPATKSAQRPLAPARSISASSKSSQVKGYSVEPTLLTPVASVPGAGTATPADEAALLSRGPDVNNLQEFFTAMDGVIGDLERMWKGFTEGRGGAREAGVRDLSQLVETSFQGLVKLFLDLSQEGMGRMFEPDHLLQSGAPSPPNFFAALETVLPIANHLDKLLTPNVATPKTDSIIRPMFDETIASFADLRGEWVKRSLGGLIAHIDGIDEGGIWEGGRGTDKVRGLVQLDEVILVVVEAETLVITTLFPDQPPRDLLASTIAHPLNLANNALQPTLNTIKRSLSSHTFVALDLYQSLARLQQRWDPTVTKCLSMTDADMSSSNVRELLTTLTNPLNTLRNLTLRSFPELLVDIRMAKGTPGPSSAISNSTHSTLTYLETLPAYEATVESLLSRSQSERSWLMGAKDAPSPARSAAEEGGVVKLFVADVLGTLLIFLDGQSKAHRRPIGPAFLLNNISHIRNTVTSINADIIGHGSEDMLNKAFRDAKTQYLAEWSQVVTLLNTQHHSSRFQPSALSGHSERNQLKESLTAFFDKFAELERTCSDFPLNRQDPDLRDRVARDVEEIVVGGYSPFYSKCSGKNLDKYLRNTPDEIGRRIQTLFR